MSLYNTNVRRSLWKIIIEKIDYGNQTIDFMLCQFTVNSKEFDIYTYERMCFCAHGVRSLFFFFSSSNQFSIRIDFFNCNTFRNSSRNSCESTMGNLSSMSICWISQAELRVLCYVCTYTCAYLCSERAHMSVKACNDKVYFHVPDNVQVKSNDAFEV